MDLPPTGWTSADRAVEIRRIGAIVGGTTAAAICLLMFALYWAIVGVPSRPILFDGGPSALDLVLYVGLLAWLAAMAGALAGRLSSTTASLPVGAVFGVVMAVATYLVSGAFCCIPFAVTLSTLGVVGTIGALSGSVATSFTRAQLSGAKWQFDLQEAFIFITLLAPLAAWYGYHVHQPHTYTPF